MKKTLFPLFVFILFSACQKESFHDTEIKPEFNPINPSTTMMKKEKVEVCHNGVIREVPRNAVNGHIAHGDPVDPDGDGFFGTWHGQGLDSDSVSYDMALDLACDFSSGIIDYGFCTGTLTLIVQTENIYKYTETVTAGCIDNCIVKIKVNPDNSIDFFEDCDTAVLFAHLILN